MTALPRRSVRWGLWAVGDLLVRYHDDQLSFEFLGLEGARAGLSLRGQFSTARAEIGCGPGHLP